MARGQRPTVTISKRQASAIICVVFISAWAVYLPLYWLPNNTQVAYVLGECKLTQFDGLHNATTKTCETGTAGVQSSFTWNLVVAATDPDGGVHSVPGCSFAGMCQTGLERCMECSSAYSFNDCAYMLRKGTVQCWVNAADVEDVYLRPPHLPDKDWAQLVTVSCICWVLGITGCMYWIPSAEQCGPQRWHAGAPGSSAASGRSPHRKRRHSTEQQPARRQQVLEVQPLPQQKPAAAATQPTEKRRGSLVDKGYDPAALAVKVRTVLLLYY